MKTDNELIAEFMGLPMSIACDTGHEVLEQPLSYENYFNEWDNLMPVVEKINEIRVEQSNGLGFEFDVTIQHQFCSIGCRTRPTGVRAPSTICKTDDVSINAVYSAVVEFIKWYNEQV